MQTPHSYFTKKFISTSGKLSNRKIGTISARERELLECYTRTSSIPEALFLLISGHKESNKCLCGNKLPFWNFSKGYRKYCSTQCSGRAQFQKNAIQASKLAALKNRETVSPHLVDQIKKDYSNGMSIKEIIKKTSVKTARSILLREKVQLRTGAKTRNFEKEFFDSNPSASKLSLMETYDKSPKEISDELTVSKNTVYVYARKLGICFDAKSSYPEIFVQNLLNRLDVSYEKNKRGIIGKLELDFFIPSKNLAIEVNGAYWHSELSKDRNYHLDKTKKCKDVGIKLIHLYDTEILEKPEICESLIASKLGENERIFARKCEVIELASIDFRRFCDCNHLAGSVDSSIRLGLKYNGSVVAAIGFSKNRFGRKQDFELTRYCSSLSVNVVGGFQKLLSHARKHCGLTSIVSYADRRFSDGNVYIKAGFSFSHVSPPGYKYLVNGKLQSRNQWQKHSLKNKLKNFDASLSENENMKNNGYYRVWDCGNLVYTL